MQPELVRTDDGSLTMRHPGVDEEYHSSSGAAMEARCLYIEGSGLARALAGGEPVGVLDVGLGLGYNALATMECWRQSGTGDLELVSLERDRELVATLLRGRAPWMAGWSRERSGLLAEAAASARSADDGIHMTLFCFGRRLRWRVLTGEARAGLEELRRCKNMFQFIWQDPFSPAKNPGLWSLPWFQELKALAAPGAVLMTYSVAAAVRENLGAAGWRVEKFPAAGRKKHWLRASLTTH